MQRLGQQAPEVPDHVWVLQVRLRVSLLAVDEGRELNGKREREKSTNYVYRNYSIVYNTMPIARFIARFQTSS